LSRNEPLHLDTTMDEPHVLASVQETHSHMGRSRVSTGHSFLTNTKPVKDTPSQGSFSTFSCTVELRLTEVTTALDQRSAAKRLKSRLEAIDLGFLL